MRQVKHTCTDKKQVCLKHGQKKKTKTKKHLTFLKCLVTTYTEDTEESEYTKCT